MGQLSKQTTAQLCHHDGDVFTIETEGQRLQLQLADLNISARIGNTSRYIELPEGLQFETKNNDAIDRIESQLQGAGLNRWIHYLESHLKSVVIMLLFVALVSWGFIQFGLPALSKSLAFSLPVGVNQSIASGTLELMDKWPLSTTTIPVKRQAELRRKFDSVIPVDSEHTFKLVFRKGNSLGANAFALPDGTVLFTDEIIKLSQHDDELVSIMAHEVGHVVERHSLRRLVQDSGLAFILLALTGDVSTSSSLLLALPALLVEASYSQAFEKEADQYALNYIRQNGISGSHFMNLMMRLEAGVDTKKNRSQKHRGEWFSISGLLCIPSDNTRKGEVFCA